MPFINSVRGTHGPEGRFPFPQFNATGGTITQAGGYNIHTFSYNSGSAQTFSAGLGNASGPTTLNYLIVGGGGCLLYTSPSPRD